MPLRLGSLLLFVAGVSASLGLAGSSPVPPCLVAPHYLEIRLPRGSFIWLEGDQGTGRCELAGEEFSGRCEDLPVEKWIRKPSGSIDLLVYAAGPSGSARFWQVAIGVAERHERKPVRGICLTTSTVGWRTLQQYKNLPLPWLDDLDGDGKAELIIWDSFPLREGVSLAEYGLTAWVYRFASEDSLAIDWVLSRRMAHEIAEEYRSPLKSENPYPGPLRAEAAAALEQFASGGCSVLGENGLNRTQ